MNYKELILNHCTSLGLDCVGTTECRKFDELTTFLEERQKLGLQNEFEEESVEKRVNPFFYMEDGKTIVSIAFPYLFLRNSQQDVYFSRYTQGNDYHNIIMTYLKKICTFIESLGGKAKAFVDNNALPERYIAYLSHVGFIGKNNMLITDKYGSYVFLGEIITNLDLSEDKQKDVLNKKPKEYVVNADNQLAIMENFNKHIKCGDCRRCYESCPTKAINEGNKNCNRCLSYITQKKHIEDYWFLKLEGRIFGCDSCQTSCPYNDNTSLSTLIEFQPLEYMINPNLNEILSMDNFIFKNKYAFTSCGWRGKNILKRNALIAACNNKMPTQDLEIESNDLKDNDLMDTYLKSFCLKSTYLKSTYLKDYYDRLFKL